jgi:hypothetical protein
VKDLNLKEGARSGCAIASLAIGLGQAWWLHTIVEGARLLNQAQIRPILLLGSLGWILGGVVGTFGLSARGSARIVAAIGIAGNAVGLVFTAITYARWWVAPLSRQPLGGELSAIT